MTDQKQRHKCPACGLWTLGEQPPGTYEICPVCFWEDDIVQYKDLDLAHGANGVSLRDARQNYLAYGATEPAMTSHVRSPSALELTGRRVYDSDRDQLSAVVVESGPVRERHARFAFMRHVGPMYIGAEVAARLLEDPSDRNRVEVGRGASTGTTLITHLPGYSKSTVPEAPMWRGVERAIAASPTATAVAVTALEVDQVASSELACFVAAMTVFNLLADVYGTPDLGELVHEGFRHFEEGPA